MHGRDARAPIGTRVGHPCIRETGTATYLMVRAVRDDDSGDAWHASDATPRPAGSQEETGGCPNAPVMHRMRIRESGGARQDHPSGRDSDRHRKRRGRGPGREERKSPRGEWALTTVMDVP